MTMKTFDSVISPNLELNDVIEILDEDTNEKVFVVITEIEDERDLILISGYNCDDEDITYNLSFAPDEVLNLYMDSDD